MVFTAIHDDSPHLSLLRFTRQQLIIPEVPGQQNTWFQAVHQRIEENIQRLVHIG